MKSLFVSTLLVAAGLLLSVPVFAQSSSATPQKTDGESPTMVGPGSGAYKQKTQSVNLASKQKTDGESPTMVGPGSGAYKQKTDGESPTIVGPGSRAYKAQ